jgi:hypothetical protein
MFDDVMREVRAENAALDVELARDAQRFARADAQRAEAARDGALGPDWQAVQRRVDEGRTTLDDVFSGVDDSPHARALREESRRRLRETADAWRRQDADDDPSTEPSPGAVVGGAAAGSERHRQEIARRIAQDLQR